MEMAEAGCVATARGRNVQKTRSLVYMYFALNVDPWLIKVWCIVTLASQKSYGQLKLLHSG